MVKRRRKIKRTPPPWKSAIGVALLVHAVVIVAVIALGWRQFTTEKPGTAIFVNDVGIDEGDSGPTQRQSRTSSLLPRGEGGRRPDEGEAHTKTPSPHPSPEGEGDSNSVSGNTTGTTAGGTGSGSGSAGAGNPVLAEIRRRIEQSKRYPSQAREQHVEGKVGVQFRIQSNGQVQNVRITHSSGATILDDAAIQAVQHSAPLPYYENTIDLSLAFRLR